MSSQQINAIVTTGASTTVGILAALSAIPGPGWVAGAITGLIALGSTIANMFHGCGSSCVLATANANKVEPILQQNLQQYLSAPVHYASIQQAALNNFQTIWQALTTACSDPSLGSAGQRCISDRQQGSCAYKTSPGGWQQVNGTWQYQYPGANNSGTTCWNWWVGYHDPIANDPTVVPDPSSASLPLSNILGPSSSSAASGAGAGGGAGGGTILGASTNLLVPLVLLGIGAGLFLMGGGKQ